MKAACSMSATINNLTVEEKREALNRVFQSQTFARSDRLKDLLRFVCEAEIEGRHDDLNEYVIGIEALGRPPGYSPSEDSSVRSRAYELRRKLDKLYATEETDTPCRIEIPKGSYVPRFIRAPISVTPALPLETAASPAAAPIVVPQPRAGTYLPLLLAFLTGVVLTAGVLAISSSTLSRSQPPREAAWTPDLQAIWKPMID